MGTKKPLAVVVLDGKILCPDGIPDNEDTLKNTFHHAVSQVPDLLSQDHRVLVFHTNSPEIEDFPTFDTVVDLPMEIWDCNGEGAVGCMLQGFVLAELRRRGLRCPVISLIPEVEIAAQDQALARPERPFGEPYSAEQANILKQRRGWSFQPLEDGRLRRLIPMPAPAAVGDLDIIRILLENGAVVIAGAGNRMPRYCQVQGESRQEEVFIDGNHLGALLSTSLDADTLIMVDGQGEPRVIEPGTMEKIPEGLETDILDKFLRLRRSCSSEPPASHGSFDERPVMGRAERPVHALGDKSQGYA